MNAREDVMAAMETLRGDEGGIEEAVSGGAGAVRVDESSASSTGPDSGSAGEVSETGAPDAGADRENRATGARQRDEHGRFKTKAATTATEAPKQAKPTVTEPSKEAAQPVATPPPTQGDQSQTPAPQFKAPQSWKPGAREKLAKADPEIQAEAVRRETEFTQQMQAASEARKFHQAFSQVVTPHAARLQAMGVDPLQATNAMLHTDALLRTGPDEARFDTMARVAKDYRLDSPQALAQLIVRTGVNIQQLDEALGQAHQQAQQNPRPQQQPQDFRDPRLDQLLQTMQQRQMQQLQQTAQEFIASKEFGEQLADDMADLIEIADKRGKKLTYEQAYEQAARMNPEVWQAMQQRAESDAAKQRMEAVTKAKAAGSSVRNHPASGPAPTSSSSSAADDVRAAMAALAGRG